MFCFDVTTGHKEVPIPPDLDDSGQRVPPAAMMELPVACVSVAVRFSIVG